MPRPEYTQNEARAGSTVTELIMKATKSVILVTVIETPEMKRDTQRARETNKQTKTDRSIQTKRRTGSRRELSLGTCASHKIYGTQGSRERRSGRYILPVTIFTRENSDPWGLFDSGWHVSHRISHVFTSVPFSCYDSG